MALRRFMSSTTAVFVFACVYGCATEKSKPTQELTKARTVIGQADKGNAQRYAAADLQRAHDELSSAENAANNRKYDEARRMAEKAEVDADLATARGNSGEAQRAAQEIHQSIETLKQESSRSTENPGMSDSSVGRM